MCLVPRNAECLIVKSLVNVLLNGCMEITTCIDRKAVAVSADVLIEREIRFLCTDVPEFLPDGLSVVRVTSHDDRSDIII